MIQQTSFLGFPLRTRMQRRLFVLVYSAFVLAMFSVAMYRQKWQPQTYIVQMLNLTLFLGGIRPGGPIKPFESGQFVPVLWRRDGEGLNLAGRKPFDDGIVSQYAPLDERETFQRDRGHYLAYRLLRWGLVLLALLYWLGLAWVPAWLSRNTPTLLWMLVVIVLSLPQCVLLWTEPPPPSEELEAVPGRAA